MIDNLTELASVVETLLAKESHPTPARIRELIGSFRQVASCRIDDADAEQLARDFEVRHAVTMTIGAVLTYREYEPWLEAAQSAIDPYYWDRYRKLLASHRFTGQVISTVDNVTQRILGLLEDPGKAGSWDRRGMVVGHVQSGKTANYIGLICKAADAGYRIIIVIAGIHNNLRNQTQQRIDEGFIGRDSARLLAGRDESFIGVGRLDKRRRPVTFTNSLRDFNKDIATRVGIPLQNLRDPVVFVIKKNTSTLKYLIEWLREHSAQLGGKTVDVPMLLIDDEADNASINIRYGKEGASKINAQIRELLRLFDRSCYVGYTATPFANIFIDPETDDEMLGQDLFPRHFIVSLDPPSNYFGAVKIFSDNPERTVRHIDDNEDLLPLKHTIDHEICGLPDSLEDAVRTFIVARAIRLVRGHQNCHCSMLVNASRFTGVQSRLGNEIHEHLEKIKRSIRLNGALGEERALRDKQIFALHGIWEREYSHLEITWPDVRKRLLDAAAPIKVIEINNKSSGTLNYRDYEETGLSLIAVGGFSLSRGLTLEGLMVSYFLRNSMMYDTLMQMGRWFGYRPGYEDLCRIWMPEEAEGWYAHITESIEMLRDELRSMEAANATPEAFGLKVRSHPDTLIVTSRNKMGAGERIAVQIGLGNNFAETAVLKRDIGSLEANLKAAIALAGDLRASGFPLSEEGLLKAGYLLRQTPAEPVLSFLARFNNHPGSMLTDPKPVMRYINDRLEHELAEWDILFASLSHIDADTMVDYSLGARINCQLRSAGRRSDGGTLHISNKQRVASRGVEKTGLTDAEIALAEQTYRESRTDSDKADRKINYPDYCYRRVRIRPLLVIHLLDISSDNPGAEQGRPVVAWSISFPQTELPEQRVEYVVNATWVREHYREEFEDEEMGGDDE